MFILFVCVGFGLFIEVVCFVQITELVRNTFYCTNASKGLSSADYTVSCLYLFPSFTFTAKFFRSQTVHKFQIVLSFADHTVQSVNCIRLYFCIFFITLFGKLIKKIKVLVMPNILRHGR